MIIAPNTTNQIKIKDADGDEVWFDCFTEGVVVTTADGFGGYGEIAVMIPNEDIPALVAHLTGGTSS